MIKAGFTVLIKKDEDGHCVVEVPDLKGCYTQGKLVEKKVNTFSKRKDALIMKTHS